MSKFPDEINITDSLVKNLYSLGLPKDISSNKPFVLDEMVRPFVSESDRMKPKRISKSMQMDYIERTYDDPYHNPFTLCIAGYPNDVNAKMLAALIMNRALIKFKSKSRTPPKWHNIYLGFDNPIVKDGYKPAFLVISNLLGDTSNQKIDKLRDCLEYHCNIPKIVVCSGIDPISFFNDRVHSQLNGCIYLQSKQVKKVNEL